MDIITTITETASRLYWWLRTLLRRKPSEKVYPEEAKHQLWDDATEYEHQMYV